MSYPTLAKGSTGKDVEKLQTLLNQKLKSADRIRDEYRADIKVNGTFGNHTEYFVRSFQNSAYLRADGKVGNKTWSALMGTEAFNCFDIPANYVPASNKYRCWAASTAMMLNQNTEKDYTPSGVKFENINGVAGGIENSHQNMKKFAAHYSMFMETNSNLTCTQLCWLLTNNGRIMINVSGIDSGQPNSSNTDSHFMVVIGARGDGTAGGTTITIYDPSYQFYPAKNDAEKLAAGAININSFQYFKTRFPKLTYQIYCLLYNYSEPIY